MCFSAEASFAGGIIISAVGVASVKKVSRPAQLVFATIPVFFGLQQISEGFLWLSLTYPEFIKYQEIFTYIFLTAALLIWPVMIPLSVMLMEETGKRKKWLKALLFAGIALSSYYVYCLFSFEVRPQILCYHIQYTNNFPRFNAECAFLVYVVCTIVPFYISSVRRTSLMGTLMFISCLITVIFYTQYLTSVWCFFAAVLSGVVYWIVKDSRNELTLEELFGIRNPFRNNPLNGSNQ
jgi:hypothetical protein